jgi:hypothetical protein
MTSVASMSILVMPRGVLGDDDDVAEDSMWWQRLYLVWTVEAALLAMALFVLVIDPHYALSPGMRQVCAISTLVLAGGACYAVGRFLLGAVSNHTWLHH